jgi:hypothetical protein
MNNQNNRHNVRFLTTVLTVGGLWGATEATLGFALHAMTRYLPVPNMAGAVMFPLAFLFMVLAIGRTGRSGAAMAVAVVAAGVKASSLILPVVSFHFVRSPVLAILAEGAVVTAAAAAGVLPFATPSSGRREDRVPGPGGASVVARIAAATLVLAVAWRALFLGLNLVLGITGGIMSKPTGVLIQFLTVESLWNAGIITVTAVMAGNRQVRGSLAFRPLWTAAILIGAVAVEWGTFLAPL